MNTGSRPPSYSGRRRKCLTCVVVVAIILHILVILVLFPTILRIRNLNVRFQSPSIENLRIVNATSFSMSLHGQVSIKNTNFGHFKYQNGNVTLLYRGVPVGAVAIGEARVKARSMKKIDITVAVRLSELDGGDVSSGKIMLTANAWLHGKVHLLKFIKRKKTARMDCTMAVNTAAKVIESLKCK